jgi:PD-(D/E)XK nuclease superfamily
MRDGMLAQILPLSATAVDDWSRCMRAYRNGSLLGLPDSDDGPSSDHGLLVHDLLRLLHQQGSCRDQAVVDDVLAAHGLAASAPIRTIVERHVRRCPRDAEKARHELELARFHRFPPPMFMVAGRIDAVWVHDGLLDARDYKTGRPYGERVAHDRRARLQAWLLAPLATREGLQLHIRYEYLAAEVPDDPEPFEPDADDLEAIEEDLRVVAESICREREWRGVADAEVCGHCRYRSICPDSATPSEPMWPQVDLGPQPVG